MTNLWDETMRKLADHNIDFDNDVLQVQVEDGYINKEIFKMMAMATNYDSGYGAVEIRDDLILVGNGWWLKRCEDDGSEWWAFQATPALLENDAGAPKLTTENHYEEVEED